MPPSSSKCSLFRQPSPINSMHCEDKLQSHSKENKNNALFPNHLKPPGTVENKNNPAVFTLAKACIISERTSESGSVPMALMRASHMKCHIWVRYSGPRTRAHSSRSGIDSAAATRTRATVKEIKSNRSSSKTKIAFCEQELLMLLSETKGYHHGSRTWVVEPSASPPAPCTQQNPPSALWRNTPKNKDQKHFINGANLSVYGILRICASCICPLTSIWQAVAFSSNPAVLMPKLCWSPRFTNSQPSSSDIFSMSWSTDTSTFANSGRQKYKITTKMST